MINHIDNLKLKEKKIKLFERKYILFTPSIKIYKKEIKLNNMSFGGNHTQRILEGEKHSIFDK